MMVFDFDQTFYFCITFLLNNEKEYPVNIMIYTIRPYCLKRFTNVTSVAEKNISIYPISLINSNLSLEWHNFYTPRNELRRV